MIRIKDQMFNQSQIVRITIDENSEGLFVVVVTTEQVVKNRNAFAVEYGNRHIYIPITSKKEGDDILSLII